MKYIFNILKDAEKITYSQVKGVIKKLENMGAGWRDYGDLEANLGRINITSKPNSIFPERITNSIDGVIEKHAEINQNVKNAKTPRKAVQEAFGIPEGGLTKVSEKKRKDIVDKVGIEIFVKHTDKEVTSAFRDKGIGLTRDEMPKTILSLNESNKIKKQYVVGQYGQGGSTTCAHSDYTIIITRKVGTSETNFTIVRFNDLTEYTLYKDGKYEYLVMEDHLPPCISNVDFDPGTLVIHVNYKSPLGKGFINYYSLIEQMMFDPPVPFWLYFDKWVEGKRRSLFGARRRLETEKNIISEEEIIPIDKENIDMGHVKLRYYLLPKGEKVSEIFSDDRNPIIITYNGQVQGVLPKSIIKDKCEFGYLYNSLIIQIDCDSLSRKGTRFVFVSTRENIREEAEKYFIKLVTEEIGENPILKNENLRREEEFIKSKIEKSDLEMKKKLVEMLNRIRPGSFKFVTEIQGEKGREKGKGSATSIPSKPLPPLPTKDEPSYLKIVNKKPQIEIPINSIAQLKLETDAPNDIFEKNWKLEIETIDKATYSMEDTAERFNVVSHSPFNGGRGRCKIEIRDCAKKGRNRLTIGSEVAIKTKLSNNGKIIFSNPRVMKIVPPREGSKGKMTEINAPDIIEINREDKYYIDNSWTENNIAEVVEGANIRIYVNMENKWLHSTLLKLNYTSGRVNKFKKDYVLHIAFHTFIQSDYFKNEVLEIEDQEKEKIKDSELDRAARTILTALSSESGMKD